MAEIITTIDLRGSTTKPIRVTDNIDYVGLGWDINDVVGVLTITGPGGSFYDNDDFQDPDFVPATSREQTKVINIPLDPRTGYTHPLKGNYTIKLTAKNLDTNDEHEVLLTYNFNMDPPVITAQISSGPYTGTFKSEDTTNYGNFVHSLTREHRIQYPTQLVPAEPDVVSTQALVSITPIYTNNWTVIITTNVEYHYADELVVLWEGTETFTECVYGGSIFDMEEAINNMLEDYYIGLASNTPNQERAQKRLVIVNNAWHLLNQAYMAGDEEECDRLCAIIQDQVQYSGHGTCGGATSELVIPAPPYSGGTPATYTFGNGLTEAAGAVRLGGSLNQATTINLLTYLFSLSALGGGLASSVNVKNDTGVQVSASSATTQGRVSVTENNVALEYNDLSVPANNRRYNVGSGGLVEASDYRSFYTARSLVSKEYVDANNGWGNQVVVTNGTLVGNGTAGSPLAVAVPFPGFTSLLADYGYTEPTHAFSDLTSHPTTLAGYGITDAPDTFLELTDTPANYTGHGGKFVKVKATADGLEFVSSAGFVPDTGGTFTGVVTIVTSNDRPLILRQTGTGGQASVPEAGKNVVGFQDGDGDLTAEIGTDISGNVYLKTYVSGGVVLVDNGLSVQGNIAVTGTVDGVDISAFKTDYDNNAVNWDTAYGWGDHAGLYQPLDSDLTAIGGLGFTATAFLKKTAANTWSLDTTVYASKDYVDSLALTVVYPPDSTTVVASDGYSGTNADVISLDASYMQIEEINSAPGIDVRFEYIDVVSFNNIFLYVYYLGTSSHIISIQLFNNNTLGWDTIGTFSDETGFTLISLDVPIDTDYINGSNEVTLRLYHTSSGNLNHSLRVDCAVLRNVPVLGGGGGGGSSDHGQLTGLGDDDHTQYALADGSRGVFFIPSGTKSSASDAGTAGQLSRDDDYLYICVVTGGVGAAVWKKVPLSLT